MKIIEAVINTILIMLEINLSSFESLCPSCYA